MFPMWNQPTSLQLTLIYPYISNKFTTHLLLCLNLAACSFNKVFGKLCAYGIDVWQFLLCNEDVQGSKLKRDSQEKCEQNKSASCQERKMQFQKNYVSEEERTSLPRGCKREFLEGMSHEEEQKEICSQFLFFV